LKPLFCSSGNAFNQPSGAAIYTEAGTERLSKAAARRPYRRPSTRPAGPGRQSAALCAAPYSRGCGLPRRLSCSAPRRSPGYTRATRRRAKKL